MSDTPILGMPYIMPNQDQKHVTHNEALDILDKVVQASVAFVGNTPPGSNAAGDRFIVGSSPTGAWTGHAGDLATWDGTAWVFLMPKEGWLVYDRDTETLLVKRFSGWEDATAATPSASLIAARSPNGAEVQFHILEEELTGLSGATVDSSINIPSGAIVFNVSERVTTSITGATSFSVGIAGEASKFGGSLGVSAGSTNMGVIGPTGFYSPTPIRLTAAGGNFTGGAVRIAIHYYLPKVPQS